MRSENTATRLKELMHDRKLKQVDILEKCKPFCDKYGVSMTKSHISQYVSGKAEPSSNKLTILGLALGVSETWLMGYDVPMERIDIKKIIEDQKHPVKSTDFIALKSIRTSEFDYSANNNAGTVHLEPTKAERPAVLPTKYFATYAKDDSMMCKGIIEGDLLIFDSDIHDVNALNGKIVLVSLDPHKEAVLRQVFVAGDTVFLQGYASDSIPEMFEYGTMSNHVKLIGRLLRVRRNYFE